ncbi:MAG: ABC transporter permease [Ruthenibacterium sp.]
MTKIKAYCQDFWRYRYLLYNLTGRDFKLKYRRSVLGVLWSVLNPLLMCLVMWAVFSSIFKVRGAGIDNFPVYLLTGQLMWNFFSEATSSAMGSVLGSAPLLRKVYIPKYIFPLEKVCFALVNCATSFVALFIVMLITGAPLHPTFILGLYPLLMLFIFSLGIGLLLSSMAVFFRDVMHLWGVFCTALMYFSAIFYDPFTMEGDGVLIVQAFIKYNPMYWYITAFRAAVCKGELLSANMMIVCTVCAFVMLVIGLISFRRHQDKFVLYI